MRRVMVVILTGLMLAWLMPALGAAVPPAPAKTWAQMLGWGPNDRVLIVHCDDVGMCHESVLGATDAYAPNGVVSSMSIMMPCPWAGEIAAYLKQHPQTDAGVHLTFTSEWDYYRWPPVAGRSAVPGLADEWGCLWDEAHQAVEHATPDEIETEIRAQVARAKAFGITPTHLDSHMGVLFRTLPFFERYAKVGIEMGIPIFAVGPAEGSAAQDTSRYGVPLSAVLKKVWDAGLPVIDGVEQNYSVAAENKKADYLRILRALKPGVHQLIVHCARYSDGLLAITKAAPRLAADRECMLDPDIKQAIKDEGIILTSWRELKARRDAVGKTAPAQQPAPSVR